MKGKIIMCLYVDEKKTTKAKKNKTGKVVRWKSVYSKSYNLLSLFFDYQWNPGWNKSNRKNTDCDMFRVDEGIHVCTTRKEARKMWSANKIIKVICYNKDLVAIGEENDAVYTKVFVPKDEYDSALKRNGVERR